MMSLEIVSGYQVFLSFAGYCEVHSYLFEC